MDERTQRVYDVFFPNKSKFQPLSEAHLLLVRGASDEELFKFLGTLDDDYGFVEKVIIARVVHDPATADVWLCEIGSNTWRATDRGPGFLVGLLNGFFKSVGWLKKNGYSVEGYLGSLSAMMQSGALSQKLAEEIANFHQSKLGEGIKEFVGAYDSTRIHNFLHTHAVFLANRLPGSLGELIVTQMFGVYVGRLDSRERIRLLATLPHTRETKTLPSVRPEKDTSPIDPGGHP